MSFPAYPTYKDSGVEWLGQVPDHWHVKAIKRDFAVIGGSTPKSDVAAYWDGDVLWATPSDLSKLTGFDIDSTARNITEAGLNSCGTKLIPQGSVILSTRAPIGSLAIAAKSLCTNQGCKSLVPTGIQNPKFLAYALSVATTELNIRGKGTTFLELSGDELGAFKIPMAHDDELDSIVEFLDHETAKIDALIREQEKLIALLNEERVASATALVLGSKVKLKKHADVDWIGAIPEHWKVMRICNLFTQSTELGGEGLPVLSVSIHDGVSDKELDDDELDRKVSRSEDRGKYKRVKPGDLVYNMMRAWQGGFGTVEVDGLVSPAYVVARPSCNLMTRYIEMLLRTSNAIVEMKSRSRGITDFRLRLYWEEFKDVRVPLPPIEEQEDILNQISLMDLRLNELEGEASKLIRLLHERRAALITAAVSGKIDVRGFVAPQQ